MPLSDEEKQKIIEEERLRAQARTQFSPKNKPNQKGFGQRSLKHPFLTGLLIIVGIIVALSLLVSSSNESNKSTNTPSVTAESKKTLAVGDEGILNWHDDKNDCTDTTPVSVDKDALSRLRQLASANDLFGMRALVLEGRAFNVNNCTKVKVIDLSPLVSGVEIRVVEGSQFGRSGWVVMEFVK